MSRAWSGRPDQPPAQLRRGCERRADPTEGGRRRVQPHAAATLVPTRSHRQRTLCSQVCRSSAHRFRVATTTVTFTSERYSPLRATLLVITGGRCARHRELRHGKARTKFGQIRQAIPQPTDKMSSTDEWRQVAAVGNQHLGCLNRSAGQRPPIRPYIPASGRPSLALGVHDQFRVLRAGDTGVDDVGPVAVRTDEDVVAMLRSPGQDAGFTAST